jgi:hypothetical protein
MIWLSSSVLVPARDLGIALARAQQLSPSAPSAGSTATATTTPVLVTNPTPAQRKEGVSRFEAGLDLYKRGTFKDALVQFHKAEELAPHSGILYYIGESYFKLEEYPEALQTLQRYLNEAGKTLSPTRTAEVQGDLEVIKSRIARVDIVTKDPGVDISIDGTLIGKSPLGQPVQLGVGRHKIQVSKTGFDPAAMVVKITSNKPTTVALNPLPPSPTPPSHHHKHSR